MSNTISRDVLKVARDLGWTFHRRCSSTHQIWRHPNGAQATLSASRDRTVDKQIQKLTKLAQGYASKR